MGRMGKKKHRKEIKEQGISQGIEQNTKETILSMIENKLPLELISKVTNKSMEEINKIIKEQ